MTGAAHPGQVQRFTARPWKLAPRWMLLKRAQDWLVGHPVQFMAAIALLLGADLVAGALVRLS
jgi:hypothetical protein